MSEALVLPSRPFPGEPGSFTFFVRRPAVLALFATLSGCLLAQERVQLDVPYVPTPQEVVDRMLQMAAIKPNELVMDVGCGDGRMVVTAAQKYGARGLGYDINPERIKEARDNAQKARVTDKVEFRLGNLFDVDISKANVLAMYLLESVNQKLKPKILGTMQPGTRIVSHAFTMGDWKPDRQESVDGRNIYLWVVPARIEGNWQVKTGQGRDSFGLKIKQAYQEFAGEAQIGGRLVPVTDGRLRGSEISFVVESEPGKRQSYRGTVEGDAIRAEPVGSGGLAWLARRQP